MAKIKFGMMMTDASGKLGGQVFSKNRGGSYVRTKVTPTNPQTSSQMSIRSVFASISSKWSGLTDLQRRSFNDFVGDYAATDIFGDLRNPSGKALFQKLNQNLEVSGQTQITTCVAPSPVPFAGLTSAEFDLSSGVVNFTASGDTTGSVILVFATPALTAGTSFVKNRLRLIDVVSDLTNPSSATYNAYVAKYNSLVIGQNFSLAVRVVNANGQASPLETIKAEVVA